MSEAVLKELGLSGAAIARARLGHLLTRQNSVTDEGFNTDRSLDCFSWIPVSCNHGTYHAQLSYVQGLPLPVVRCTFSPKQHLLVMQHQPPLCCFGYCVHGPAPLLPKEPTCLAELRSSGVPVWRRQCSAQLGAGPLPLPVAALYLLPRAGALCGAAPGPPLPPGGPCARPRPTDV